MYIDDMRASTYRRVKNVQEIGQEMYRLVDRYANDLSEYASMGLHEFFEKIARLPYRKEPGNFQLLSRPEWTLSGLSPVVACANKAIICGSWAKLRKYPFRFVAVGRAKTRPLNHVFCQIFLNGSWQNIDATYSWLTPFHSREWSRLEILKRR